jgi:hypothetical protein
MKQASRIHAGLSALSLLGILLLFTACQPQELKVYLEIKLPDLSQYKNLVFNGLTLTGFPQDLETQHIQTDFFLGDLARQYKLNAHNSTLAVPDPEKIDADAFRELAALHEQALFITGRMDLSTKEHSMVRERRDEKIGKRIRSIVKLNQMQLKIDLFIYNPADGRLLWKKSYTQQANEFPSEKTAFTFRSLFYKCTDRFTRDIGLQERRVRRTLIDK